MSRVQLQVRKGDKTCRAFVPDFTCKVGQNPSPSEEGEVKRLRPGLRKGYTLLKQKSVYLGALHSPTGSGKSSVVKALAFNCAKNYQEKSLIIVPDSAISSSFGTKYEEDGSVERFKLPDGQVMEWMVLPDFFLFGMVDASNERLLERLRAWAKSEQYTIEDRVCVCTHTLANMLFELDPELFRGLNLFVDEGHHSKLGDKSDTKTYESVDDERRLNQLGKLVEFYIENKPGRLFLITATFFRGDSREIVPKKYINKFTHFEYALDEYLSNMTFLKEVKFRFCCGDYKEVVAEEMASAPETPTIVYLPPVMPGSEGEKDKYLSQFQAALGKSVSNKGCFTQWHKSKSGKLIKSLDLVTVEGRESIRERFDENEESKNIPDAIFAQNLMREGADWPKAARAIVCGTRSSLTMLVQMLGRLLRDLKGKSVVDFLIVLPKHITGDISDFDTYSGTILKVMTLGWLFQVGLQLPPAARNRENVAQIESGMADLTADQDDTRPDIDQIREMVTSKLGHLLDDEEIEVATKSLLACVQGSFRVALKDYASHLTPEQIAESCDAGDNGIFTAIRALYSRRYGVEDLKEILGSVRDYDRTLDKASDELLSYYKKTGCRPTAKTHPAIDDWLRTHHNSSVTKLSNDLGIPGGHTFDLGIEGIVEELVSYFTLTGERPSVKSHRKLDHALRTHYDSSIPAKCDELGMPGGPGPVQTLDGAKQTLLAFHKDTGRRPTNKTHSKIDLYLRTYHQSSVTKLCTDLGIPGGYVRNRTLKGAKQILTTYHLKTGKRPTQYTHGPINLFLARHCRSSVSKLCDELGL